MKGSIDRTRGVYGISVAAGLVGTGMQNLRVYERKGLLHPTRSAGGTRLYSVIDGTSVGEFRVWLNRIIDLLADGLTLAGVAMVLDLQDDNSRMRNEISNNLHRDENHDGSPETSS